MRTNRRLKKKNGFANFLLEYINNNLREYIIVIILFLIGITASVMFINNVNETQLIEISDYINEFIDSLKNDFVVDKTELLKQSLINNLILTFIIWIAASTVIGIPIVMGVILYRSFCLGYTLSSALVVLGTQKGIIFIMSTIFLQNIIFIPVLITLAVNGLKLYKSIMKNKNRNNIKVEIIKYTILCFILYIMLAISSLVEVYISTNVLNLVVNYL